jgi:hypothetical protein
LTPPAYFKLEEAGYKSLGNLADHDDIFASTTYLLKRSTIAANPTLPELLIKAQAEAIKRFYDDKAFAVKAYQVYDKQTSADVKPLKESDAKAIFWNACHASSLAPFARSSLNRPTRMATLMKEFDFHKVIDNSIVGRRQGKASSKLFGAGIKAEEDLRRDSRPVDRSDRPRYPSQHRADRRQPAASGWCSTPATTRVTPDQLREIEDQHPAPSGASAEQGFDIFTDGELRRRGFMGNYESVRRPNLDSSIARAWHGSRAKGPSAPAPRPHAGLVIGRIRQPSDSPGTRSTF